MPNYDFEHAPDWDIDGMDCIEKTVHYYPDLARKGYCFCGNKDRRINGRDINNREKESIKKTYMDLMSHMSPIGALCAIDKKAFWRDGRSDPKMFPIFVRITDEKELKLLGYKPAAPAWNRFNLMDLDDE